MKIISNLYAICFPRTGFFGIKLKSKVRYIVYRKLFLYTQIHYLQILFRGARLKEGLCFLSQLCHQPCQYLFINSSSQFEDPKFIKIFVLNHFKQAA